MKILKGNIVDIVNKRIFKGEIHFTNIIHKIVEKDVTENVFILPGFVNSHVHIESSMLSPYAFSKSVLKHGTVAVVSDPHEIANVCGIEGIQFMIDNAKETPLKIFYTVPSCVPATTFETSGATIDSSTVKSLLSKKYFVALSEMMNFPGVIFNDVEVHKKLTYAKQYNKPVDGHAPKLSGENLIKYINAGISTDHECSTLEEAIEKIKLGMKIQIREGSAAKNFDSLSSLIDLFPDNVMLCTDDSHPDDLLEGHINTLVKRAFKNNLNYFNVLKASSLNAVKHYNLPVGLLQLNDPADFIICNNQHADIILDTYINGQSISTYKFQDSVNYKYINKWNEPSLTLSDLEIPKASYYRVIECIDGELLTNELILKYEDIFDFTGQLKLGFDKIVVINRYVREKPSLGIIKNINLKNGAFGSTIAHDSHNILIAGHDDLSILSVFNKLSENMGGLATSNGEFTLSLPLPIGGLMTNDDVFVVATKYKELQSFVNSFLGSTLKAPFMTLSFMALLVIPEIKIGDKGLFKINDLSFVPLVYS